MPNGGDIRWKHEEQLIEDIENQGWEQPPERPDWVIEAAKKDGLHIEVGRGVQKRYYGDTYVYLVAPTVHDRGVHVFSQKKSEYHDYTPEQGTCPNCEKYVNRYEDDDYLTCHRCGWQYKPLLERLKNLFSRKSVFSRSRWPSSPCRNVFRSSGLLVRIMQTCRVCGGREGELLHTCNHCGRTHCSEHQLPENHLCIPPKSRICDESDVSDTNWSSQKHKRTNVMEDKRRSGDDDSDDDLGSPLWTDRNTDLERHGYGSDDRPATSTDDGEPNRQQAGENTKRPLDEDEINSDVESSPQEWVEDVKRNREALNERLEERHREWEEEENASSATASEQQTTTTEAAEPNGFQIPRTVLIALLFVALTAVYLLQGNL